MLTTRNSKKVRGGLLSCTGFRMEFQGDLI